MAASPGTSTARGPAREEAICAAVMELLAEVSYDALTVDAVAARAKASKATIYRRWAGKDALVVDVLHREFLGDGRLPEDTGSLRGDLLATLQRDLGRADVMEFKMTAIRSISTAATAAPELVASVMAEITRTQMRLWEELIARALDRGEIDRAVPAELGVEVLRGQLCAQSLFAGGNLGTGYLEHLVDDIVIPVILSAGRDLGPEIRGAVRASTATVPVGDVG